MRLDPLLWIAVPLLAVHVVARTVNKALWPAAYDVTYYRSFLLYAVPFMLLGILLAKYREPLIRRFSSRTVIVLAAMGCCLQFAEYALTRQSLDFYFGSILYATSLFLLGLKYPEGGDRGIWNVLRFIGQRLSMQIYLVHMLCIEATGLIFSSLMPGDVFGWIHPLLSIACSRLIAFTIYRIETLRCADTSAG